MATLIPRVRYIKDDGTARIHIQVEHKDKRAFIPTEIYITAKDITKEKHFKKSFYSQPLEDALHRYRKYIADLGYNIHSYDAESIKQYIIKQDISKGGKYIDFIAFCEDKNAIIKEAKGKNGTFYANLAAVEWLKKFEKSSSLNVNSINKEYLKNFSAFLELNGVGMAGISSYLRALRTLFIQAMDKYNEESRGEYFIKHYPFRNFKIVSNEPKKRSTELNVLRKIILFETKNRREEIGRDMFLLTFLFAGISPVDLYKLTDPKEGYISYCRDKLKRRKKRMQIRIHVTKQADEIVQKYSQNGFLSNIKSYASEKEFSRACNKGLGSICNQLEVPKMTLYWARHTFATVAADLEFDTNLIDYVLGHAASEAKMAEVYIRRKQTSVDELVRKVIAELYRK